MAEISQAVNASGYPLQMFLEHLVSAGSERHGWMVLAAEHRWTAPDGSDGYLDLVQRHSQYSVRVVVECKRISGDWIFPAPAPKSRRTRAMKFLVAYGRNGDLNWERDDTTAPESGSSPYCVMSSERGKTASLEKISGDLLLGCESLAQEETLALGEESSRIFYVPVIVTTAKLHEFSFMPEKVDPDTGFAKDWTAKEVPYIRFAKPLPSRIAAASGAPMTLDKLNYENERTVFVVQAKHFIGFLGKFKFE